MRLKTALAKRRDPPEKKGVLSMVKDGCKPGRPGLSDFFDRTRHLDPSSYLPCQARKQTEQNLQVFYVKVFRGS